MCIVYMFTFITVCSCTPLLSSTIIEEESGHLPYTRKQWVCEYKANVPVKCDFIVIKAYNSTRHYYFYRLRFLICTFFCFIAMERSFIVIKPMDRVRNSILCNATRTKAGYTTGKIKMELFHLPHAGVLGKYTQTVGLKYHETVTQ